MRRPFALAAFHALLAVAALGAVTMSWGTWRTNSSGGSTRLVPDDPVPPPSEFELPTGLAAGGSGSASPEADGVGGLAAEVSESPTEQRPVDAPPVAPTVGPPPLAGGSTALVKVVDSAGAPVTGVGVQSWTTYRGYRTEGTSALTDATGTATVEFPYGWGGGRWGDAPDALAARAVLPFVPVVSARVAFPSTAPVTLRLPPSGRVVVRCPQGVPAVQLRPFVHGAQEIGTLPSPTADVVRGVAQFPHVGLGLRFAAVSMNRPDRVSTVVEFDGPTAAGRAVTVDLPEPELRPVLEGRLVGTDGTSQPIWLRTPVGNEAIPWRRAIPDAAMTDRDGRFRFQIDATAAVLRGASFTLTAADAVVHRGTFGDLRAGGRIDVGDVRLGASPSPPPLLVAGRVTDDRGGPVAGADVAAARRRGASWRTVATGRTDSEGRFELRWEAAPADAWELRSAHGSDVGVKRQAFRPRQTGVELTAIPTVSAVVTVLVPKGVRPFEAADVVIESEVRVVADDADSALRGTYGGGPEVHFGCVPVGRARIVARAHGDAGNVLAALDVNVIAGGTPNLGTIDLRSLPTVRVRLADGAGAAVADGAVWWRPSRRREPASWFAATCGSDGVACVPAVGAIDVLGCGLGTGFAEARNVSSDATLTVPAAMRPVEVVIVLGEGCALPEPPLFLSASLTYLASDARPPGVLPDPRNGRDGHLAFDATTRRVRTFAFHPGRYGVVASLHVDRGGRGRGQSLALVAPAETTIRPGSTPDALVVRISPEELARVRARLLSE